MEKWKEVFKNIIPKGNYQIQLRAGEENGLTIELFDLFYRIRIDFGSVQGIRILDEGMVQTELYSNDEIRKFKQNNFANIIYEICDGEFERQIHTIAGSYCDTIKLNHYIIITMNYNIDVITKWEPTAEVISIEGNV